MISIIVCTIRESKESLERKLKCCGSADVELIVIDNQNGRFSSITQAYNYGYSQSRGDIIVFVHDDVEIQTEGWLGKIRSHFAENEEVGIIGLAGSAMKTKTFSTWWQAIYRDENPNRFYLIQSFKFESKEPIHYNINPKSENLSRVVTIDGVFIAVRKNIFELRGFSETDIKGYHGYDLDFCLAHLKNTQVAVIFDVLINHHSEGYYSSDYLFTYLNLHDKYKNTLPVVVPSGAYSTSALRNAEKHALINFVKMARREKLLSNPKVIKHFIKQSFYLFKIQWNRHILNG